MISQVCLAALSVFIFSALTSAFSLRPYRTLLCRQMQVLSRSSSAFKNTVPLSGIKPSISVFALKTPGLSPSLSRWAFPMSVYTASVGLTICARRLISPKSEMPISITAASCSGSMRNIVSGTPSSLLKFLSVLSTLNRCDKTDEIISFAVVFPTEPVIPTTGMPSVFLYPSASRAMAFAVLSTTIRQPCASGISRSTMQHAAPSSNAFAT